MKKIPDILYEDTHLIVINKPAGILTLPDRYQSNKFHLKGWLESKYGEIYVVHRLDFNTSGIILFTKTATAHKHISGQFENGNCKKEYWALTYKPTLESDIIDAPIAESQRRKGYYKVHDRGKKAITKYRSLQTWQRYALLSLDLITGRTHQIRVHLKHIGAPLLTDDKYSANDAFYLSEIKRIHLRREQEERPLLNRSSLHARTLSFIHPESQAQLTLQAPLHKDMKAVINQLVKRYGGSVEY